MRNIPIILFLLGLAMNTQAIAGHHTYKFIKSKLKLLPEKQKQLYAVDIGEICEFIAKELVGKDYRSSQYVIKSKISYSDQIRRNEGELDIVVFNRKSQRADLIIEVKCRKNQERALEEAFHQLNRFKRLVIEALDPAGISHISIYKDQTIFSIDQFKNADIQVMMPKQRGSTQIQPWEFDLTLEDIRSLQEILIGGSVHAGHSRGTVSYTNNL